MVDGAFIRRMSKTAVQMDYRKKLHDGGLRCQKPNSLIHYNMLGLILNSKERVLYNLSIWVQVKR